MTNLGIEAFDQFFQELHSSPGKPLKPYPWQQRLAALAAEGRWPAAIDVPTGSGKTAALDVAVFALACQAERRPAQRTVPVRVFFCVNRRVIVDEACQRARRMAEKLLAAEQPGGLNLPVLRAVAAALRQVSGISPADGPPLDVLELRGGIYRDNRWARSLTQPTIICTTIDQLGSRLLFRGYGVSDSAAPIQAALIAYDSLVLLDEAHISRPFRQTLAAVRQYLDPKRWAEQELPLSPMKVVPMTATPPDAGASDAVIRLDAKDRENEGLRRRLEASKPTELREPAKDVADAAVKAARRFVENGPAAVGIIVNRVATARQIFGQLQEATQGSEATVELVIGSMRPIDRDEQAARLANTVGSTRPPVSAKTSYVVATQCLEVGADYDFDFLVTECASLDALRQRFGRLNRGGRQTEARAAVIVEKNAVKPDDKLTDDKPADPIYGNALARTWNWLQKAADAGQIDFGINAFNALLEKKFGSTQIPPLLLAPSALSNAPVMMPAYVDFWCQTSPQPEPDPDVSLFLHGKSEAKLDVQVCWRADLLPNGDSSQKDWIDIVSLLPPTSPECMTVPISRVREWLDGQRPRGDEGDMLETAAVEDGANERGRERPTASRRQVVRWRGAKEGQSQVIDSQGELRPGDTLVIPATLGGWNELGHVPQGDLAQQIDVAEKAHRLARGRVALRLHRSLVERSPYAPLLALATRQGDPPSAKELEECVRDLHASLDQDTEAAETLGLLKKGFLREPYPGGAGLVLTSRRRLPAAAWSAPSLDDGDDARSRVRRDEPVLLETHISDVQEQLESLLERLPLGDLAADFRLAARWHDLGKADERFQAMLWRQDRTFAALVSGGGKRIIAKSDGQPTTPGERRAARLRAQLPDGFRHEMLSVQLAERCDTLAESNSPSDLALHVVAAHHGYARPLAPVVIDDEPPDVTVDGLSLTSNARRDRPPHRLDSGIAERFWRLTRRYGWWGLAYLEAVLRLADQQASAREENAEDRDENPTPPEASPAEFPA